MAASANPSGEVDRQTANHRVASLYLRQVKMRQKLVNHQGFALRPLYGSGMAGDEVGGHGEMAGAGGVE